MPNLTLFQQVCQMHGLDKPADFLRAFQATANFLGESVTLTDRQFRRWRQPSPPAPRARAWRVLHAMVGLCPTELGFPGPPPGVTVGGEPHRVERGAPDVDRRAFLADSLGTAAAMGLPSNVRPIPALGKSGAVGTAHLLELREGLRSLFQLDDAYGGGDVRRLSIRHLRRVRRIINTGQFPDTIGRQLQLLAGETAEHCGWLHFDAGEQDTATRYWGEALATATMLKDTSLEIMVFSTMSLQATHQGRARDGLDLARAAQDRATRLGVPVLQSIIASRESRALSAMGDERAASQRLADAMRHADQTGRGQPAPAWTAFHGHAELEYAQGLLYADLGHHHSAVQFMRAALAHQDRNYGRNRALYRMCLANVLVKAGEVDEGAALALDSLEHMEEVESSRVMQRLADVTDLLRHIDARAAHAAVDELTEYARTRGAA